MHTAYNYYIAPIIDVQGVQLHVKPVYKMRNYKYSL